MLVWIRDLISRMDIAKNERRLVTGADDRSGPACDSATLPVAEALALTGRGRHLTA